LKKMFVVFGGNIQKISRREVCKELNIFEIIF
jgi:hypothetical protein